MTTNTKHAATCRMAFGRFDVAGCARCLELAAGAPARTQPWRTRRAHNAAMELAAHFAPNGPHALGTCGPVCTFGDY